MLTKREWRPSLGGKGEGAEMSGSGVYTLFCRCQSLCCGGILTLMEEALHRYLLSKLIHLKGSVW